MFFNFLYPSLTGQRKYTSLLRRLWVGRTLAQKTVGDDWTLALKSSGDPEGFQTPTFILI